MSIIPSLSPEEIEQLRVEIIEAVDAYIALSKRIADLRDTQPAKFTGTRPPAGTKFVSVAEYAAWVRAKSDQNAEYQRIQTEIDALRKDRDAIIKKLMVAIPVEVWFKDGDRGFGIAVGDWGGASYALRVAPWADSMPSLDSRYHGD